MRLWSISPIYLDQKGLCGLWRESLLAQNVLKKGEYITCPNCNGAKEYKYFCDIIKNKKWVTCPKCKGIGKIKTPYYNHPQLKRFKDNFNQNAINIYLYYIWYESNKRGYKFNHNKIPQIDVLEQIKDLDHNKLTVTNSQLIYEFNHLQDKLYTRDKKKYGENLELIKKIESHPLFKIVDGPIEEWEKILNINYRIELKDIPFSNIIGKTF